LIEASEELGLSSGDEGSSCFRDGHVLAGELAGAEERKGKSGEESALVGC
jgi:hypothetical protein